MHVRFTHSTERFCETLRRSSGEPSTKKGCWQFHPWNRHLGAEQLKGGSTPSLSSPPHGVLFALISKSTTQTTHSTSILVFKELVENKLLGNKENSCDFKAPQGKGTSEPMMSSLTRTTILHTFCLCSSRLSQLADGLPSLSNRITLCWIEILYIYTCMYVFCL